MNATDRNELKRAAALRAIEEVEDGMVIGLGTGSTAAFVVEGLAARVVDGLRVIGIPTSERTAAQAAVRVVIEGADGGTWYLNVSRGEMTVTAEPAFPPLMTVYQPRSYFAWAASMATEPFAIAGRISAAAFWASGYSRRIRVNGVRFSNS